MTYKFAEPKRRKNGFAIFGVIAIAIVGGLMLWGQLQYIGLVPTTITPGSLDAGLISQRVFQLVNVERERAGMEPLEWNNKLAIMAEMHSKDMAARNFYDHNTPEGKTPMHRAFDVNSCFIAENIMVSGPKYGYSNEESIAHHVVQAWMTSEGHRDNILRWSEIGVGAGITSDGSEVYITQDFC